MVRFRLVAVGLAMVLALSLLVTAPGQSQISLEEVEARSVEATVELFPVNTPSFDWNAIEDLITGAYQLPTGRLRGRSTTVVEVTAPYNVGSFRMWLWRGIELKDITGDGVAVRAEGREVRVSRRDDTITLSFAPPLRPNTRVTLHFEFEGKTAPIWNEFVWIGSGEIYPELISPFGDFNQNRAPAKVTIIAPAAMTIVSSGSLASSGETAGRRRWVFQSDADFERVPVLGGRYQKRADQIANVPLEIYTGNFPCLDTTGLLGSCAAGGVRNLPKVIDFLRKSYEFQTRYLGPVPFRGFVAVTFPDFWIGGILGVAYPGIMMLNDEIVAGTIQAPYSRDSFTLSVVAHEFSHSYWGMIVQAKGAGWICLWECFAEYTGLITVEAVMGAKAFQVELDENRAWYARHAGRDKAITFYTFANAGSAVAAAVRYAKGSLVLHMLRYVMGDAKFQETLRTLVREFGGKAIRLETVQEVAERVHGSSLEWFFKQWFREVVLPDYQIASVSSAAEGSGYKTTATVKNAGTGQMPVEVGFVLDNNERVIAKVTIGGKEEKPVTVTTERRVVKVVADPNRWLLQSNYKNDEAAVR